MNKLIAPGMSAADVTKQFGSPGSITEIGQGIVMWTYSFPIQPERTELHLGGFSVYLKDGKVEKWSPVMEESRKTFGAGATPGAFGEQSFRLFVANDRLTNVANAVESDGSADASSLKASPDLEFRAQVFTGSSGNERPGEQTVILVLAQQDASKLEVLTQDNFGKRLLIVCRNRAIAVPVISAPFVSRQVMFTVKGPSALSSIQGK
jgi:hypothetical protein